MAALLGTIAKNYGLLPTLDMGWPSSDNQEKDDAQIQMLYDDLDAATQLFSGDASNMKQLFDPPRWGSLNSGHYFGMKLTIPQSIEASLMWFDNSPGSFRMRHLCDQNDRLDFYSWVRHDFWSFGEQEIHDGNYRLSTSYIVDEASPLEWQAKITVDSSVNQTKLQPLSLVYYITVDQDDKLELDQKTHSPSVVGDDLLFSISGFNRDIGDFRLNIMMDSPDDKLIKSSYLVGYVDKLRLPLSTYLLSKMVHTDQRRKGARIFHLPSRIDVEEGMQPNIIAVHLILEPKSSIVIEFKKKDATSNQNYLDYDKRLVSKSQDFDRKFELKFPISQLDDDRKSLARISLSNMIGSVGYFYGFSYIGSSIRQERITAYGPLQLITGVPSRSFFPRGFLWDEGFHNLLISQWDPKLSNKIIVSWFDIMNKNGWIPREVILGIESMRRVPNEFIVQRIANANPPAMLLVIESMLNSGTLEHQSLKHLFPRLKQWFNWFNMTQLGQLPTTYRWRGRDELSLEMLNPKTLTSGLDDYPRASHPFPSEYHIDLRCWMALASRTLASIAEKIGDREYASLMSDMSLRLSDNGLLNQLHWSDKYNMYCDFGINSERADLVWVRKERRTQQGKIETFRKLERQLTGQPRMGCVPEFGYVSLFPMIMKILEPESEQLGIILKRLRDEKELWTRFGIRSLSKSSQYYLKYNTEHDKPYWRGPIWLNLNYLILSSLRHYSIQEGPYRENCSSIYAELKENLVQNVLSEFKRTNYLWENYDDTTGRGQGSHPFTGWSSLILLIMSDRL